MAPPSPPRVSELYATQMASLKSGHALWRPEGRDGSDEIQVGDVGFIDSDGSFVFLFSIDKEFDNHPSRGMRRYLPESICHYFDFDDTYVVITTTSDCMGPGVYSSRTIRCITTTSATTPSITDRRVTFLAADLSIG